MAQQVINIGTVAGDGTGDTLRDSQRKTNENFSEVYTRYAENLGMVTPASAPTGSGINYWDCLVAGTYANFGGVVLAANSRGLIFRNSSGVFSLTQQTLDLTSKVNVSDVVNNLTSTETTKPLSAAQGKVLQDGKVNVSDVVNTLVSTETTKPLSAAQGKALNEKSQLNTINFDNKSSLTVGKNKFNKATANVGKSLDAVGELITNATYTTSDYIPVIVGQQYKSNSDMRYVRYYDAFKVFVPSTNVDFITTFTPPAGAVYARFPIYAINLNTFQLEIGATATTYESYEKVVKESEIDKTIARKTDIPFVPDVAKFPLMTIGKNLYNPDDCAFGDAWGAVNALYNTTGYIDIHGNDSSPLWTSDNGTSITIRQCKFFDSNKVIIGGMIDYPISGYIIPAGAYYVKYAFSVSILKFQIELGLGVTFYEPYTYLIQDKNIPSNIQRIPALVEDLQMPSTLYLTNQKIDLFFTPIVKNFFKKNRFVRLSATNSTLNRHFTKLATITPTANGVASFTMYDDSFNILTAKSVNTVITPIAKTGNLKTIFVGSSITRGAKYIEYIKTVCGAGVSFLGMRHENATGVKQEGRGGWGLASYFSIITARSTAYNPFYHPTTGRYWGSTAYWADVMTNAEFLSGSAYSYDQDGFKTAATAAGFLSTGKISGAKLLTNDIMYDNALTSFVQWNGSAWNTISQPATWGIDFVKYGAMWDIVAPDLFFIAELATNDFRGSSSDPVFTTWNSQVEQILTALKVWNASAKLALTINFSSLGGDNNGTEFQERNSYRMWQCRKNCITNFDNRVGDGIYLIDNGIGFDEDYGFDLSTDTNFTIPNALYTGAERLRVQSGNPHPNQEGNNLLGKCLVGIIQYLRA